MIINVLMPTYNDEKTIVETLDSLKKQTYKNWHLTIINDGSMDNTEKIVKDYIKSNKLDEKITYIYEDNSDQLNALKKGFESINKKEGLVYVLHSDDLMNDENVFQNSVNYFKDHEDVDAIISDYNIIDENSDLIGYQKVKKYNKSFANVALMGLWLGRNLFVDVAFWKYDVYKSSVYYNYLTWNIPFWINSNDDLNTLNVKNVDFPFFKYRVFEGNYINNEIGLLNVLNGEIRTLLLILNKINIPCYKLQYLLFRLFNKTHLNYRVIYTRKRSKNIYSILKFVINKRISDNDIVKYPYYNSILNFFKNYCDKSIIIDSVNEKDVYLGSDVRFFNKNMLDDKLPKIYYDLFNYMNNGFNKVIVNKKNYDNIVNILKFFDIFEYVSVIIK